MSDGPVEIPTDEFFWTRVQVGYNRRTHHLAIRVLVPGLEPEMAVSPHPYEKGDDVSGWCEDVILCLIVSGLIPERFHEATRERTKKLVLEHGLAWNNTPGKITREELAKQLGLS